MDIAPATAEDCRAIAEVQVRSWQHAYRDLLPADYLAGLDVERREAQWRTAVESGWPHLLLARHERAVVGFIAFGPSRDRDAPPQCGEVWALYLEPSDWSRGWGRSLWLAARAQLSMQGLDNVSLWVLDGNARAMSFYRAAGFVVDAASVRTLEIGGALLRELRYVTRLHR